MTRRGLAQAHFLLPQLGLHGIEKLREGSGVVRTPITRAQAQQQGSPGFAALVVDGQSRLDALAKYLCAGFCRIDGEGGELGFAHPRHKIATPEATGDQLGRFAYRLLAAARAKLGVQCGKIRDPSAEKNERAAGAHCRLHRTGSPVS